MTCPRISVAQLTGMKFRHVWSGRTGPGRRTVLRWSIEFDDIAHYTVFGAGDGVVEAAFTFGGSSKHWPERDPQAFVDAYNAWHEQREARAA